MHLRVNVSWFALVLKSTRARSKSPFVNHCDLRAVFPIKVGQSFSENRDLGCERIGSDSCLFGDIAVRHTGLSANDQDEYRLTDQSRDNVEAGVLYPSLDIGGITYYANWVHSRMFVYFFFEQTGSC